MLNAAILSIGDELTLGQNIDTNSAWIAEQLLAHSIETVEHRTVADDLDRLSTTLTSLLREVSVLILTGGLGPTEDDLTREALARVLTPDDAMVRDEVSRAAIERRFARVGLDMPVRNLVQADRPRTMTALPNPHGTAPGLLGVHANTLVIALPGPPREMKPMFEKFVRPALIEKSGASDEIIHTERINAFGLGESWAAERLGDLMRRREPPFVGTTISDGILSARVRASGGRDDVATMMETTLARIRAAWGAYVFGAGSTTLAEAAVDALRHSGRTVALAESCTGGWLAKSIVDVAGSSDVLIGGWVTYSNAMKVKCLDVTPSDLDAHGAVSSQVAVGMATGERTKAGSDLAVSITGIAGPGPSEGGKPAGLVFIGIAEGDAVAVHRFQFPGDRTDVRQRTVGCATQLLRWAALGERARPLLWEQPLEPAT